jgi:dUTP pyrophosphatase
MFESGRFVADHLGDVRDDQIQPNGVDLTLDAVYEQVEPGRVGRDGKEIGERRRVVPAERAEGREAYYLPPGGYVVAYADVVRIPDGHVGFVLPRSSLMRNSCMLNTAVWDAGYEGRGEGLLEVHRDVELERGARVAQLVLAEADHDRRYAGSYQGERLDEYADGE